MRKEKKNSQINVNYYNKLIVILRGREQKASCFVLVLVLWCVCAGHRRSGSAAAHSAHGSGVYGPEARPRHQTLPPHRASQDRLLQTIRQLTASPKYRLGNATGKGWIQFWTYCILVENYGLLWINFAFWDLDLLQIWFFQKKKKGFFWGGSFFFALERHKQ